MRLGTGAIEIKSYGLTIDGELKCRVIKRMSPIIHIHKSNVFRSMRSH
jgi:hypothetical protein